MKSKLKVLLVLATASLLITNILFFIDEGYYDFRWMLSIGNWVAFIIYTLAIFLGELLFHQLILRKYSGRGKIFLSVIAGSTIGVLFLIEVVFRNVNS